MVLSLRLYSCMILGCMIYDKIRIIMEFFLLGALPEGQF